MARKEKVLPTKGSELPEKKVKGGPVDLPKLQRRSMMVYLIGETPLIVHCWSQKAKIEMLAKQMGQPVPKLPRSPVADFMASIYRLPDGGYGFPATGIKKAIVSACSSMNKELSQVLARQAFFIQGEEGVSHSGFTGLESPMQLLRVHSPNPPRMREDAVRVGNFGNKKATLAYRAEFSPWAMKFELIFNALVVSPNTVANVIDTAGFAVGLGEWRQEKAGIYGACRLADTAEQKLIDKWARLPTQEPRVPSESAFLDSLATLLSQYGEAIDEEDDMQILNSTRKGGNGKGARQ